MLVIFDRSPASGLARFLGIFERRAARVQAGLGLSRMAERAHFAKSSLSMVETGKRVIAPEVVTAYEQVHGMELAPPPTDSVRVAHEWLVAESPIAQQTRVGRRVDTSGRCPHRRLHHAVARRIRCRWGLISQSDPGRGTPCPVAVLPVIV
jgi:hypothetical protein